MRRWRFGEAFERCYECERESIEEGERRLRFWLRVRCIAGCGMRVCLATKGRL
jgi:hypothetical protein